MPSVESDGAKLYLVDDAGHRGRIHDVFFADHRTRRVALGDPRANHRFFVAKDGSRRAITLAKQSRALDAETLAGSSRTRATSEVNRSIRPITRRGRERHEDRRTAVRCHLASPEDRRSGR